MDSFELNKILGAILGTLLFVMGVGFLAEAIYAPIEGRGPGYELPEAEATAASAEETTGTAAPAADIGTLLASANVEAGQGSAKKCQSCHNFEKGGANKTGPDLYGVVGRPIASHEGFDYSPAMKQHAAEVGNWTYAELNIFLTSPADRVPGTKMRFSGIKDDAERANVIAFLSTLSDNPVPFPAPEAAPEQPTPGSEGAAPTPTEAGAVSTPEGTQSETPAAGTPTQSNTPAGAEPAGESAPPQTQSPAPSTEAAPAANAAPAASAPAATAPAESAAPAATETQPAAPAAETEQPAASGATAPAAGASAPAADANAAPAMTPAVPMTPPAAASTTTTTTAQ